MGHEHGHEHGHTVLTCTTKVQPARVKDLEGLLGEIEGELKDKLATPRLPFGQVQSLHFASLVVFHDPTYGPYLVFENNFDGPPGAYLSELVERAGAGLHEVYRHCQGYPAAESLNPATLRGYLRAHVVRPGTYHVGNVNRDLARIRQERALRNAIEDHLDELVRTGQVGSSPGAIREQIQAFVRRSGDWAWAIDPRPHLTWRELHLPKIRSVLLALAAAPFLGLLVPVGLAWALMLYLKERSDAIWPGPPSPEHLRRLEDGEDQPPGIQNHVASLSKVKPGRLRRATLRLVLWAANLSARASIRGSLSGIPSIHFAHWSLIDNGERLLFLSNFDGSWENYLDDFIDKAASGLTGIWSNTEGFPRTYGLLTGGARDGPAFKAIARDRSASANVWYSAYDDLTVQQIDKHSAIRADLFTPLDDEATKAWLRNF